MNLSNWCIMVYFELWPLFTKGQIQRSWEKGLRDFLAIICPLFLAFSEKGVSIHEPPPSHTHTPPPPFPKICHCDLFYILWQFHFILLSIISITSYQYFFSTCKIISCIFTGFELFQATNIKIIIEACI